MQQWFETLFPPDSRSFLLATVAIGVVVAFVAVVIIFRVVTHQRLRIPKAARTRQPRLGLVDAFSLDGQRQLVLVRRDNVEHLVMIGGPNDVLLESHIIRSMAASPIKERDVAPVAKAGPEAAPKAASGPAAPVASPAPTPKAVDTPRPRVEKRNEPPAKAPVAPPITPATPIAPTPARPEARPPSGRTSVAVAPSVEPVKPAVPPANDSGQATVSTLLQKLPRPPERSGAQPRPPADAGASAAVTVRTSETFARTEATMAKTAPPASAHPVSTAPDATKDRPKAAPKAPEKPESNLVTGDADAGIDSLEAEMARLLGRDA